LLHGGVCGGDGDACGVFKFVNADFGELISFLSAGDRSGPDSRNHGNRTE
jgi:hypothetical protein